MRKKTKNKHGGYGLQVLLAVLTMTTTTQTGGRCRASRLAASLPSPACISTTEKRSRLSE